MQGGTRVEERKDSQGVQCSNMNRPGFPSLGVKIMEQPSLHKLPFHSPSHFVAEQTSVMLCPRNPRGL